MVYTKITNTIISDNLIERPYPQFPVGMNTVVGSFTFSGEFIVGPPGVSIDGLPFKDTNGNQIVIPANSHLTQVEIKGIDMSERSGIPDPDVEFKIGLSKEPYVGGVLPEVFNQFGANYEWNDSYSNFVANLVPSAGEGLSTRNDMYLAFDLIFTGGIGHRVQNGTLYCIVTYITSGETQYIFEYIFSSVSTIATNVQASDVTEITYNPINGLLFNNYSTLDVLSGWTASTNPYIPDSNTLYSQVIWVDADSQFVIVGDQHTSNVNQVLRSTNGITWNVATTFPHQMSRVGYPSVAYATNGDYVIVGLDTGGLPSDTIVTVSTDSAVNWSQVHTFVGTRYEYNRMAYYPPTGSFPDGIIILAANTTGGFVGFPAVNSGTQHMWLARTSGRAAWVQVSTAQIPTDFAIFDCWFEPYQGTSGNVLVIGYDWGNGTGALYVRQSIDASLWLQQTVDYAEGIALTTMAISNKTGNKVSVALGYPVSGSFTDTRIFTGLADANLNLSPSSVSFPETSFGRWRDMKWIDSAECFLTVGTDFFSLTAYAISYDGVHWYVGSIPSPNDFTAITYSSSLDRIVSVSTAKGGNGITFNIYYSDFNTATTVAGALDYRTEVIPRVNIGAVDTGAVEEALAFNPDDGLLYRMSGETSGVDQELSTINPFTLVYTDILPSHAWPMGSNGVVRAIVWYPPLSRFVLNFDNATSGNPELHSMTADGLSSTFIGTLSEVNTRGFALVDGTRLFGADQGQMALFEISTIDASLIKTIYFQTFTTPYGLTTRSNGTVYIIYDNSYNERAIGTININTGAITSVFVPHNNNVVIETAAMVFDDNDMLWFMTSKSDINYPEYLLNVSADLFSFQQSLVPINTNTYSVSNNILSGDLYPAPMTNYSIFTGLTWHTTLAVFLQVSDDGIMYTINTSGATATELFHIDPDFGPSVKGIAVNGSQVFIGSGQNNNFGEINMSTGDMITLFKTKVQSSITSEIPTSAIVLEFENSLNLGEDTSGNNNNFTVQPSASYVSSQTDSKGVTLINIYSSSTINSFLTRDVSGDTEVQNIFNTTMSNVTFSASIWAYYTPFSTGFPTMFYIDSSSSPFTIYFFIDTFDLSLWCEMRNNVGGSGQVFIYFKIFLETIGFSVNEWHMYTFVLEQNAVLTLYIDERKVLPSEFDFYTYEPSLVSFTPVVTDIYVGTNPTDDANGHWQGYLKNFVLSNQVFTPTQITSLYQYGTGLALSNISRFYGIEYNTNDSLYYCVYNTITNYNDNVLAKRFLGTIDTSTAIITNVLDLPDNSGGLTFDTDTNIYVVTNNKAVTARSLYQGVFQENIP